MRGVHSAVDDIRRSVFTEVARLAYESDDYKQVDMIPYKIVPGEVAHGADTFAAMFWNKGGWIQNRANTLATWCMFAQVFPLFQVGSKFAVLPSLYGKEWTNGLELATAAQPTYANPTAQGVMAILAIVVNVLCITIIIKRSLEQKKNPYKNEIFTDQKDFQIAMARAEEQ